MCAHYLLLWNGIPDQSYSLNETKDMDAKAKYFWRRKGKKGVKRENWTCDILLQKYFLSGIEVEWSRVGELERQRIRDNFRKCGNFGRGSCVKHKGSGLTLN